jgi:uncharacterized membrane protein
VQSCSLGYALLSGGTISLLPFIFRKQGADLGRQLGLQISGHFFCGVLAFSAMPFFGFETGGLAFLGVSSLSALAVAFAAVVYYSVVTARGPTAISWPVTWTNALLVAVGGWIFFGEEIRYLQPVAFAAFAGCLVCMGLATHRRYCRVGDPDCEARPGFWFWLPISTLAFAVGNTLMKAAGRQADPGGPLSYVTIRCLLVAAAVVVYCRMAGTRPVRDRRTLLLALAFAGAFLPAVFSMYAGLESCGASTFFPAAAGAAIFFGLLWSLVFGGRPPKLAWLGAALAALSIYLLHASGGS